MRDPSTLAITLTTGLLLLAPAAGAADRDPLKLLDNDFYRISLNVRSRMELAKIEGSDRSRANTIRVLAGVESKPLFGFTGFVQLESNSAINNDRYWDQAHASNGKTAIPDARHTSINQGYGRYQNDELWGLDLIGGRQMIVLDDARFVGNVGWRQNMQTYDSVRGSTTLGIDGLRASSAYIYEVLRIFDDQGPASQRDFDSASPIFHVAYDKLDWADLSVFMYELRFDNSPDNSSSTYGFRSTGVYKLNEDWSLPWVGSYSYQTDADRNPTSYHAHYIAAEVGAQRERIGTLTAGYELLGSDSGKARVVTPLATGHKFNGYADAFLDNGGVTGLQDLYFTLTPDLPFRLKGHLTYHRFWSHDKSKNLGQEMDMVLTRPLHDRISSLLKIALFDGKSPGPADRWRTTIQVTFNY